MSTFLNGFAKRARSMPAPIIDYIEKLFAAFFDQVKDIPRESFAVTKSGRFNIAAFEGIFRAVCAPAFRAQTLAVAPLTPERLLAVRDDPAFLAATQQGVGRTIFVKQRAERAMAILGV